MLEMCDKITVINLPYSEITVSWLVVLLRVEIVMILNWIRSQSLGNLAHTFFTGETEKKFLL